jgi:hypothetical protein
MNRIKPMSDADQAIEKTYRAIGRFVFEFSQVEHFIKFFLGEVIGLGNEHFDAVMSAFDVAKLCNVAKVVFSDKVGANEIEKHLNRFIEINSAHRVPRVTRVLDAFPRRRGCPSRVTKQARSHNVRRAG